MRFSFKIALAALTLTAASANNAGAQMRFQGQDDNRDGVIMRNEWRGNDQSFRNQDWNGDGVLSGDEVRPGARRQTTWNQDWNRDGIIDNQDTLISSRFRGYDVNGDSRVAAGEWPGDQRLFTRLDTNRDRYLTMQEYVAGNGMRLDSQGGPAFGFSNLDLNRDGWITRNEWRMGNADFDRLDANRDNRISNVEFQAEPTGSNQPFAAIDANRDGWVTRTESGMTNAQFSRLDVNSDNRLSRYELDPADSDDWNAQFKSVGFQNVDRNRDGWLTHAEWQWDDATFRHIDVNNDNRLSRFEFETASRQAEVDQTPAHSAAWRTGYDRGIDEGRRAGLEDAMAGRGWDLEGQTELERADSGYYSQVGSFSDYQAGYREGFRNAYREGYNTR